MRHTNNDAPTCPVCKGSHYPASNGTGRRVHCDGTPAETRAEHLRREQRHATEHAAELAADSADVERLNRAHALANQRDAGERREQRTRDTAKRKARAAHARRINNGRPPIDDIDRHGLPDSW